MARHSYLLIFLLLLFSSCNYFKNREREKERKAKQERIEICKETVSYVLFEDFFYDTFSITKQIFAEKNKNVVFGAEFFIEDIFKMDQGAYLLVRSFNSELLLEIPDSELTKLIIENDERYNSIFCFFSIEASQLINKYNIEISDVSIENDELIDYYLNTENDVDILFRGTLISICH